MKISAVVQARMSSKRLPGKVLRIAKGKPLLQYVIERLARSVNLNGIIVATSTSEKDAPIAAYCREKKIICFRGPLDDVAARFLGVVRLYHLDAFVRICADSPYIDSDIVDHAISVFQTGPYDIVTNVFKRTFPKGESVEVMRASSLVEHYLNMKAEGEVEHFPQYFYKKAERFKIFNLEARNINHSKANLSIDTQGDFTRFISVLDRMTKPHVDYDWEEVVKIYKTLNKKSSPCLN